jgi:hypothetical protein
MSKKRLSGSSMLSGISRSEMLIYDLFCSHFMEHTYNYTYKPERRKLTLLVDKNLIELARQNNINLSRFLEAKLEKLY